MNQTTASRRAACWAAITLTLIVWTVFGLWQGLNTGFSGGLYDPTYHVPGVRPGSAAARAGFQAGDRVVSVEGRRVEELGMESRWPRALARPQIGTSYRFVVDRGGRLSNIDYVYPAPSRAARDNRIRSALIGLGTLVLGVWAGLTAATPAASALLPAALCAGVSAAAGLGPGLGVWNGVMDHVSTAAFTLQLLFLLRFFLVFPRPKRQFRSRLLWWILGGLWGGLVAFLIAELRLHPALYYSTGSVATPLMLLYVLLIVAAILHTLWTPPRGIIRGSGMPAILGALIAGLGGMLSEALSGWSSGLPVLLIPLTLALGARRQQCGTASADDAAG